MVELAALAVAALLMLKFFDEQKQEHECPYCGRYKSHDDHCPYTTAL